MCFQSIHSKCPAAARVGFIPILPTADKIQSKCPAAARVGINPTPPGCILHCCTLPRVGAGFLPALPIADKIQSKKTAAVGFIPVLPTADKIQSKYPAAARVGINPTPTLDVCCRCLIISGLQRNKS